MKFTIASRIFRAVTAQPYERLRDDPVYRPLKIFTRDPAVARQDGAAAVVNVPYEPLETGPTSSLFRVDSRDGARDLCYRSVDLNDPAILISNGRAPSATDVLFHQQMVYAVATTVYATFRTALGRHIAWGFEREREPDGQPARLVLRPHACNARNAYYDRDQGEICFGYYQADPRVAGMNLPRGYVFTCLSHDVIVHEVSHALLDGLRPHFSYPSRPDALAFHEAFSDLVAIFQHFSYQAVVEAAIRRSGASLERETLLTDLATQFGHTTGSESALRSAVDTSERPLQYGESTEPHALGSVLVSAVFDAFIEVYRRKVAPYLRLASGGTGVFVGDLPIELQRILASKASQLASQFLNICIRAIDYCPPVDLEFGEFLRAVITADYDLVPDDPWGYREAWVNAFRRRGIYPRGVPGLTEDALLWRTPGMTLESLTDLSFASLRFNGDPGHPAGPEELHRQAAALGRFVSNPDTAAMLGFVSADDPRLRGDRVTLPCVESIRTSRRVGPNGQVAFDLVAEVTQRRTVRDAAVAAQFESYGGATLILGPKGEIRYLISKSVLGRERLRQQREFVLGSPGHPFWMGSGQRFPRCNPFRVLHEAAKG